MANIQTPKLEIDYLNAQTPDALIEELKKIPSQQFLFNKPKQTQLTDAQISEQIGAGLNLGSPHIAAWQKAHNVVIPQTEEEIYKASLGIKPNAGLTGNIDDKSSFLDNLFSGYKENYTQGFEPSNLKNRNKPFSQKLGEGFGTAMRFIDSPLGRGTLAGLAALGLGGNAGQALGYGLNTGVIRQKAQTADKVYRDVLAQQGIDTTDIRGNITDEVAKNASLANYRNKNLDVRVLLGVLKDNTSRAKLINTMLNQDSLSPEEALERMQEFGIPIESLEKSNQTKLISIRQKMVDIAKGRLGIAQQNANTAQKNAQTAKNLADAKIKNMGNKVDYPIINKQKPNKIGKYQVEIL